MIDLEAYVPRATERAGALAALQVILRYGWIDGDHHKAWVLDQAVRALTGPGYEALRVRMAPEGDWDVGIAP